MDAEDLLKIATLCGSNIESFGRFDLSSIGIARDNVHPDVAKYFDALVPESRIAAKPFSDRDICRLYARSELKEWNQDAVPSCDILMHGFVTIGSDLSGDAFAVDVREGSMYLVSHEEDWDEILAAGEPGSVECRATIADYSTELSSSIGDFFKTWLAQLRDVEDREHAFAAEAKLNPNATDDSGNTQLVYLIRDGNLSAVREEIARGADLERFGRERRTALGEAVTYGHLSIVKLLLDSGANPNAKNDNGETPLMIGAHYSKAECIRTLLQHGADRAATDNNGETAYDHICSIHGTPEIEDLLRL